MKLQLKSNGIQVEVKKADFEKFTPAMKRNYDIIDHKDAPEESTTSNTVAKVDAKAADKKTPETGEKK